jgi:SNF2 family DNA or RNA helicase
VDESFFIKNPDSKRTQALKRLREWCGRAYVLCGTPAPNSPHDIIEQFNFVDFGLTFRETEIPKDRDAALPVIQACLQERGLFIRHLKQDVLPELPPKSFRKILLKLEPVQRQLYRTILTNLFEDLKGTDDISFKRNIVSFLAKRSALLQLCSNPSGVVDGYSEIPAKILALDSILRDLIESRHEKIVLWSFYTGAIDRIMARYKDYAPVRYDGTINNISNRRSAVDKFQNDSETMLFVGNPAAAGAGLTLHRSSIAIYESFSNQAAHYLQSIDRIHRRGQRRETEYLILLCDGTLEAREFDRMTKKEEAGYALLGDPFISRPTRESMLSDVVFQLEKLSEPANV